MNRRQLLALEFLLVCSSSALNRGPASTDKAFQSRQADIPALIRRKPRIFCSAVLPRVAMNGSGIFRSSRNPPSRKLEFIFEILLRIIQRSLSNLCHPGISTCVRRNSRELVSAFLELLLPHQKMLRSIELLGNNRLLLGRRRFIQNTIEFSAAVHPEKFQRCPLISLDLYCLSPQARRYVSGRQLWAILLEETQDRRPPFRPGLRGNLLHAGRKGKEPMQDRRIICGGGGVYALPDVANRCGCHACGLTL